MANSKGPYFLQYNYHSGFGPHTMQIPIRHWQAAGGASVAGDVEDWDLSIQDADGMINSLCDLFLPSFPVTVHFDNYIIFKQVGTDEIYTPVAGAALASKVGTNTLNVWHEAVQITNTWRSTNFGIFKIVFLDAESGGSFGKTSSLPGSGSVFNLNTELTSVANAFMARDNGRPSSYISTTVTLNEKLRKSYRVT
jgi:hypothetical protein